MSFKPLADHIVVRPIYPSEAKTPGGLIVPETIRERPQQGHVVAIGPGRKLEDGSRQPLKLSIGERVLYTRYTGTEITDGDSEYLILREGDLLAVIEEER